MTDLNSLARQGYFVPDTYYNISVSEVHVVESKGYFEAISPSDVHGDWCATKCISSAIYVFRNFKKVDDRDKEKVKSIVKAAIVSLNDPTRMGHEIWSALCDIMERSGERIGSGPLGGTVYLYQTYSQARDAYDRCNRYLVDDVIRMKKHWDKTYGGY